MRWLVGLLPRCCHFIECEQIPIVYAPGSLRDQITSRSPPEEGYMYRGRSHTRDVADRFLFGSPEHRPMTLNCVQGCPWSISLTSFAMAAADGRSRPSVFSNGARGGLDSLIANKYVCS